MECDQQRDQMSTVNTMDNDSVADMMGIGSMAPMQNEDDEYELELERRLDMGRQLSQDDEEAGGEDVDFDDGEFKAEFQCK